MSWIEIAALAILPLFLLHDLLAPAADGGPPRGWRRRAAAVTGVNFALSLGVGAAYGQAFGGASLFDGAALGTLGGTLLGIVVYEFFHYLYHRSAHRFDPLWRLHQLHHSAERLDPWGAYFLHPLDAAIFLSLSNLVLYPLLGLDPLAGAIAAAWLTFAAVFQHARMATPRWLGFVVQRPESPAVHHARGVHAFNYAGLPLWDLVFGTFRNPPAGAPQPAQGLGAGASERLGEMLRLRDVSAPRAVSAARR